MLNPISSSLRSLLVLLRLRSFSSSSSPPTRVPALARPCSAVVAAKSATPQPTLPGTIFTVAAEVEALGAKALPVVVDLRDEAACVACVQATVATFGGVDILINHASALWWQTISDTPTKKYDLIQGINARGAFIMTRECLPHMRTRGWGRVVCMGPPLPASYKAYAGKTAYYMVWKPHTGGGGTRRHAVGVPDHMSV